MDLSFEFCSILDDFNANETILLFTGSSIVNVNGRLECRPFRMVRNIVVALVIGILARVSSTYLLYR